MAPRTRNTGSDETAAFNPAALRQVHAEGIPGRVGRPRNLYTEWQPEIDALREAVGTDEPAFSYPGIPNVGTVVSGLKRVYGVSAAARDMAEDKSGTLWLEYPATEDGQPDEDAVAANKAKHTKS
jgi:hypothetical protein